MGLFSSIIHIWERDQEEVKQALMRCIAVPGFDLSGSEKLNNAPSQEDEADIAYYVSPQMGKWTAIIEARYVGEAPSVTSLAQVLSADLKTSALVLMVHDDDLTFYNLYNQGKEEDGYNSNPQYFEQEKLLDGAILEQMHEPKVFAPLLPSGITVDDLEGILTRGWWEAYLDKNLDEDGLPLEDEPFYVFEHHRMIAIGNLLQLHGQPAGYPFADWNEGTDIDWRTFLAIRWHSEG